VAGGQGRLLVFYDDECGFCAWGLAWLLRWDRRHELSPVAIQSARGSRALSGVPVQRRLASWHVCDQGGRLSSAGGALVPVLARVPGGGPLAALAARFPRATEAGYGWVAAHRAGLGRFVSPAARRRARALIARRMH
jgi:predicted DCC family thiol-disulfide oxidoreductase YuxK